MRNNHATETRSVGALNLFSTAYHRITPCRRCPLKLKCDEYLKTMTVYRSVRCTYIGCLLYTLSPPLPSSEMDTTYTITIMRRQNDQPAITTISSKSIWWTSGMRCVYGVCLWREWDDAFHVNIGRCASATETYRYAQRYVQRIMESGWLRRPVIGCRGCAPNNGCWAGEGWASLTIIILFLSVFTCGVRTVFFLQSRNATVGGW